MGVSTLMLYCCPEAATSSPPTLTYRSGMCNTDQMTFTGCEHRLASSSIRRGDVEYLTRTATYERLPQASRWYGRQLVRRSGHEAAGGPPRGSQVVPASRA